MRRASIDTSEARSFEPTMPGPYQMLVDEVGDPKPSAEKGTLGFLVYFKFADPEKDQVCGRVQRWYALEGKGTGFTREFWKASTGEDLPIGQEGLEIDLDAPIGRPVIVQVGNEPYEGRIQNTAETISAPE